MTTLIHERVSLAQRGQNQTLIGRMASGWAVRNSHTRGEVPSQDRGHLVSTSGESIR